ncbi:MAG: CAP domain-containing protein, partial [Clostridia bacterium]|nr:CAP domain-containing protein [Clostridia bacterium]
RKLCVLGIDTATDNQAVYSDMNQVAAWAKADINYCLQEGILKGIGNNLVAPLNNATREQAICFVERVRAKLSEQPSETNEPPSTDEIAQFEQEVVRLVNVERINADLEPLNHNVDLSSVARTKSQDMVDNSYFSHTSPTYGSPFDMMKSFGINYSYAGENIAMGQATPEAVVKSWMNSDGHKRNILSANFTDLGVGLAKNNNGTPYWTQMFISTR